MKFDSDPVWLWRSAAYEHRFVLQVTFCVTVVVPKLLLTDTETEAFLRLGYVTMFVVAPTAP